MLKKRFVVALEGLVGPAIGIGGSGSDGEDAGVRFGFLVVSPENTLEEGGRPLEMVFEGIAFSCMDQFKHSEIDYGGF